MSQPEFDPYLNDPERWGVSLAQMAELMLPCLDASALARWPRSAPTPAI